MLAGVKHIHDNGLIHRDLKPANIFLGAGNKLKIGDFGLAKSDCDLSENSVDKGPSDNTLAAGTPLYQSPEQKNYSSRHSCETPLTNKVDIFACGLILFELSFSFTTVH
jgi:serine/threonine protein kinase